MTGERRIARVRLALNGLGSIAIAVLCLPIGLPGLIGFVAGSLRMGGDPDGADKVLGIQIFAAILGAVAVLSLVRTVKTWRALAKTQPAD